MSLLLWGYRKGAFQCWKESGCSPFLHQRPPAAHSQAPSLGGLERRLQEKESSLMQTRSPAQPVCEAYAAEGDNEAVPAWAGGAVFPNGMLNEVMSDTGLLIWEKTTHSHLQFHLVAAAWHDEQLKKWELMLVVVVSSSASLRACVHVCAHTYMCACAGQGERGRDREWMCAFPRLIHIRMHRIWHFWLQPWACRHLLLEVLELGKVSDPAFGIVLTFHS